jgi:hypothetical protein
MTAVKNKRGEARQVKQRRSQPVGMVYVPLMISGTA